ncbi:putative Bacterial sugar transferase family protein [Bradyrhizobium sp. ORS 278]|uniref:undecaprenyl-phosphate glucose phosphotransferase n=1 Tax=Bradyrhizobium sp. (strain ORS 278) TaxID=114615 RepID=UPI00015088B2|nr:undecaprenyl-phosphate glucose phosphotransferase [Bradyrhizobium sp. ORS 278]CAL78562.1 putative Bacterial sugar transferase family protein [Bradyrhizobium sp. ORS 278]
MHYVDQPETLDRNGMPGAVLADRQIECRKWPIHYGAVEPFAITADIATIAVTSVLSGYLYHFQDAAGANDVSKSVGLAILVSALFVSLMKIRGMYRPAELLILSRQIRATCLTWITAFLVLAGALFALKIGGEFSRGTSIVFAMLGLTALVLNRRMTEYLLAKGLAEKRFSGRNIVLITDEASQDNPGLSQALVDTGFRVRRHFLLPDPGAAPDQRQHLVASVIDYVRGSDIEEIVVGASPDPWSELRTLGADLRVLPFPVSFVPVGAAAELFNQPRHDLGSTVCVELHRGLMSPLEHATKRLMDLALAGTALLLLSPLLLLVAIAIKLDSAGPVFFRQQRCGFNGRSFQIYKFRTMSVLEDGPTIVQAKAGDSRFTRLGAWLRRTSIDELPQLLNVMNGSMSLVGPRPHALAHDNEFDKLVRNYAFRRRVKPGLTGWAQVHGCRGPTPTRASIEQRVEFDLWYIDNWSLSLDIAILLRTPIELIRGDNAY